MPCLGLLAWRGIEVPAECAAPLAPGIRLLDDRRGVTAIEYALMGALIAVVISAAVGQVGTTVLSLFTTVSTMRL